ncbi:MAG TPA: hypothetical protein VGM22_08360 [Methylomirabilota bacterium]
MLASPRKSDGRPNFHAWGYVEIARAYRRDALVALRAAPGTYVTAVRRAWRTYLRPTTEYEGVAEARARVGRWADAYEALLYGRVALPRRQMPYYLTLLLGLPALFVWGVRVARRAQAGPIALDAGAHAIVILALLNVAYVAVAVNAAISTENMRFRYLTDGLSLVLLALLLERWRRARAAAADRR